MLDQLESRTPTWFEFLADFASSAESLLLTLFVWFLSLIVPTACLIGFVELAARERIGPVATAISERWTAGIVLVFSSILSVFCMSATAAALTRGERPFGPSAAQRQWRLPVALRLIPSAWWLGHFLVAALIACACELNGERYSLATTLLISVVAFVMTGACNLFLLFAITALGDFQRLVRAIWRWRFLVDLIVAVLPLAVYFVR